MARCLSALKLSFFSLFLFVASVFAQTEKPPKTFLDALEAANNGDYKTAAASFRQAIAEQPTIVKAHYGLGRVLIKQGLYAEALDAFQELVRIDPQNLLAHYEIAKLHLTAKNYPIAVEEYRWLKGQAENTANGPANPDQVLLNERPLDPRLSLNAWQKQAAGELAQYLLDSLPREITEQYELPAPQIIFADPPDPNWKSAIAHAGNEYIPPMSSSMRPKILYQEKAKYTEIARINRVSGTVMLSVVFDVSGKVNNIRVVRGLPDGLTQRAIQAAEKIRFQAATTGGHPVSVRGSLEFSFNLY